MSVPDSEAERSSFFAVTSEGNLTQELAGHVHRNY
jgi:hypothetical protein